MFLLDIAQAKIEAARQRSRTDHDGYEDVALEFPEDPSTQSRVATGVVGDDTGAGATVPLVGAATSERGAVVVAIATAATPGGDAGALPEADRVSALALAKRRAREAGVVVSAATGGVDASVAAEAAVAEVGDAAPRSSGGYLEI